MGLFPSGIDTRPTAGSQNRGSAPDGRRPTPSWLVGRGVSVTDRPPWRSRRGGVGVQSDRVAGRQPHWLDRRRRPTLSLGEGATHSEVGPIAQDVMPGPGAGRTASG